MPNEYSVVKPPNPYYSESLFDRYLPDLLRTVHPTDSYYAKSGRTSEYRSIGVSDLGKKGERDDTASAYVLRPLKPLFVSIYGRSDLSNGNGV